MEQPSSRRRRHRSRSPTSRRSTAATSPRLRSRDRETPASSRSRAAALSQSRSRGREPSTRRSRVAASSPFHLGREARRLHKHDQELELADLEAALTRVMMSTFCQSEPVVPLGLPYRQPAKFYDIRMEFSSQNIS